MGKHPHKKHNSAPHQIPKRDYGNKELAYIPPKPKRQKIFLEPNPHLNAEIDFELARLNPADFERALFTVQQLFMRNVVERPFLIPELTGSFLTFMLLMHMIRPAGATLLPANDTLDLTPNNVTKIPTGDALGQYEIAVAREPVYEAYMLPKIPERFTSELPKSSIGDKLVDTKVLAETPTEADLKIQENIRRGLRQIYEDFPQHRNTILKVLQNPQFQLLASSKPLHPCPYVEMEVKNVNIGAETRKIGYATVIFDEKYNPNTDKVILLEQLITADLQLRHQSRYCEPNLKPMPVYGATQTQMENYQQKLDAGYAKIIQYKELYDCKILSRVSRSFKPLTREEEEKVQEFERTLDGCVPFIKVNLYNEEQYQQQKRMSASMTHIIPENTLYVGNIYYEIVGEEKNKWDGEDAYIFTLKTNGPINALLHLVELSKKLNNDPVFVQQPLGNRLVIQYTYIFSHLSPTALATFFPDAVRLNEEDKLFCEAGISAGRPKARPAMM